jgi:hypothetical protein
MLFGISSLSAILGAIQGATVRRSELQAPALVIVSRPEPQSDQKLIDKNREVT